MIGTSNGQVFENGFQQLAGAAKSVGNAVGNAVSSIKDKAEAAVQDAVKNIDWQKYINSAIQPVTNIPNVYHDKRIDAENRIKEGVTEMGQLNPLGVLDTAVGALDFTNSPVAATIDSIAGQPIQNVTGIPKDYTDFLIETAGMSPEYGADKLRDLMLLRREGQLEPLLKHMSKEAIKKGSGVPQLEPSSREKLVGDTSE